MPREPRGVDRRGFESLAPVDAAEVAASKASLYEVRCY